MCHGGDQHGCSDDSLDDNSGITFLAEAESWDAQQLDDRQLEELLHLDTEVLEDSEDKHEAVRWLADKLLPLDETGYCPLLTAAQDCLEQVYDQLKELSEVDEKAALLTWANNSVLIPLDFRSACRCWQLYTRLAKQHVNRLLPVLDLSASVRLLSRQLLDSLHSLLEDPDSLSLSKPWSTDSVDRAKNANKQASIAAFMAKVLSTLSDLYQSCLGDDLQDFLHLLLRLLDTDYSVQDWFSDQLVNKLRRDIFSPALLSSVLRLAGEPRLESEVLLYWDKESVRKAMDNRPFPAVLLILRIMEGLRSGSGQLSDPGQRGINVVCLLVHLFSKCGHDLSRPPSREGITVPGRPVLPVDNYHLVLTRLCSWLATASAEEFAIVENCLISQILINPTGWTALLLSDVWAFVGRYGTSDLCLSHVIIISKIISDLPINTFSSSKFFIESVLNRLFKLLTEKDQQMWAEQFSPVEASNLLLWSLVDLSSFKTDKSFPLDLANDIVHNHLDQFLAGDTSSWSQVMTAGHCLAVASRLFTAALVTQSVTSHWLPELVTNLWRKLAEGEFTPSKVYWQSEFFSYLISSTCSVCSYLPPRQLAKLLHNVLLVLRAAPPSPHLLVHAVRLLGRLVEYTGEADISAGRGDGRLLAEMAALYRLALVQSASHAPVMMEGLKAFSSFAHNTNHGAVLGDCVDESVKKTVEDYIAGTLSGGGKSWEQSKAGEKKHVKDDGEVRDRLGQAVLKLAGNGEIVKRESSQISLTREGSSSPSSKKRKIGDVGVVGGKMTEDVIDQLVKDADKLLNCVSEEKENNIEKDKVEKIEKVIEKLKIVVANCKVVKSDGEDGTNIFG